MTSGVYSGQKCRGVPEEVKKTKIRVREVSLEVKKYRGGGLLEVKNTGGGG